MIDNSNICVPCGLCCDGTVVGYVALENEEIPVVKKLMEIEDAHGNGFFLLPCKNLCNDGCSIYNQRPKQCDKFKCGLLNSFERNDIEFGSAIKLIDEVKQRKADILKKIELLKIDLKSPSFYFKMKELKKMLLKLELTPAQQELKIELNQLDNLIAEKFNG